MHGETMKKERKFENNNVSLYGRSRWPRGLRPFASWDCGFESRRGYGCLSVVSVVCCQVHATATGRSFVQRNSSKRVVSESDLGTSIVRRPRSKRGLSRH